MKLRNLVSRISGSERKPAPSGLLSRSAIVPMSREVAVVGLGRFGVSLARTLLERGFHVLGIDKDQHLVDYYAEELTQTIALDATDEHALREIDIGSFDTVVVAIGDRLEDNVLATATLKDLGVRQVVCKAASRRQKDILLRVGADRVVQPEYDAGKQLGQQLAKPNVIEQIVIGPVQRCSLVKVTESFIGRTLQEADFEKRFNVKVIAVVRNEEADVNPPPDHLFQEGDMIVVFGHRNDIARLAR
jgi:trk system potassium uptake protein TrkA